MRFLWWSIAVGAAGLLFLTITSNAIQVTGATTGFDPTSRERPVRREINDLAKSGPSWDLYILALQRFQNTPSEETLSYFQVAGIHGYPNIPWDGVNGTGSGEGYCMHASVLFPLWHRPYLALYEQVLSYNAQAIAKEYPRHLRDTYLAAASTLRIPYWDWTLNTGLPSVVTAATLPIRTQNGLHDIANPLLQYTFPVDMVASHYFDPMSNAPNIAQQPNTVRHYDPVTKQSNQVAASSTLQDSSSVRLSRVYSLFTELANYTSFSLYRPNSRDIEGIHGGIHNDVGGLINGGSTATGHLTVISMSAFDPAFWLHHANVDRMVAIWQALHPDEYVQPTSNERGTYYLPAGSIDTETTPLAPFHNDSATNMWTAAMVRDLTVFGYTYPELTNTNASTSELRIIVTQEINNLYAPSGTLLSNMTRRDQLRRGANVAQAMSNVHADTALQLGVNNMDVQWQLRISIAAIASLEGVAVFLFIGHAAPDVESWPAASNLIGLHTRYFADNASNSSTSLQQIDVPCSHTIAAAVNRGLLANTSPEAAVPFLLRHVVAKAVGQDGTAVDAKSVSGIEISILSRKVQPRESLSDFPVYGTFEVHASITA